MGGKWWSCLWDGNIEVEYGREIVKLSMEGKW